MEKRSMKVVPLASHHAIAARYIDRVNLSNGVTQTWIVTTNATSTEPSSTSSLSSSAPVDYSEEISLEFKPPKLSGESPKPESTEPAIPEAPNTIPNDSNLSSFVEALADPSVPAASPELPIKQDQEPSNATVNQAVPINEVSVPANVVLPESSSLLVPADSKAEAFDEASESVIEVPGPANEVPPESSSNLVPAADSLAVENQSSSEHSSAKATKANEVSNPSNTTHYESSSSLVHSTAEFANPEDKRSELPIHAESPTASDNIKSSSSEHTAPSIGPATSSEVPDRELFMQLERAGSSSSVNTIEEDSQSGSVRSDSSLNLSGSPVASSSAMNSSEVATARSGSISLGTSNVPPKLVQVPVSTTFVFIGNPGSGKSTLVNCLSGGYASFRSGLSFGGGLTQVQQAWTSPTGMRYVDTPGLADETIRKQAAEAIEDALKYGGKYKVIFVLTLEAGRVRPDDKATMKLVLKAAPQIKSNYAIVVNKVPKETLLQLTDKRKKLLGILTKGFPKRTKFIWLCENYPDLNDKNNALVTVASELVDFIYHTVPVVKIDSTSVSSIQYDKFAAMQQKLAELKQAKAENSALKGK